MFSNAEKLNAQRECVLAAYVAAERDNRMKYIKGDDKATSEYIYSNQKDDAIHIVDHFYISNRRVVSVQKKTKVGADGLMIEVAKLMTTHIDDEFVVDPENVRIITGMSNAGWEKDMIEKAPICFKRNIFHHDQLKRANMSSIRNGLIIIDEIDSGDKDFQVLHRTLKDAALLDVENMKSRNNRFLVISATMIKELYDLSRWGDLHQLYTMTIPEDYIGHQQFLKHGIIQEFYPLDTNENAEKWIREDILENYGADFRVNFVRVNNKTVEFVENACIKCNVQFRNHTSVDRLSDSDIKMFFKDNLFQHIVIAVKGLLRRANLIPNAWKLRIGATHEFATKHVDNNVQIQGLPGRMSGYWRKIIEVDGHRTGPHRTSILAIQEYEETYLNPFGDNSYTTAGFSKRRGKVHAGSTMLSPKNVANLAAVDYIDERSNPVIIIELTHEQDRFCFAEGTKAATIFERLVPADVREKYASYNKHFWKNDWTIVKSRGKLDQMLKPNAMSRVDNMTDIMQTRNTLMMYNYDHKLILSPWSGEKTPI